MTKHDAHVETGESMSGIEGMKESIVPTMAKINEKVVSMKDAITENPDTTADKIIRLAVPALIGIAASKVVELGWKKTTKQESTPSATDTESNIFLAIAFAVISAIIGTVVSRLSTVSTNAFVNHRQKKRATKLAE